MNLIRAMLVTALALLAFSNSAQPVPQLCGQNPWACFGSVELRVTLPDGPLSISMQRYANGELRTTGEQGGVKKQLLAAMPSGLALYSGLAAGESTDAVAKNPLMFLDMAFAYPLMALQMAYPGGAPTVPEQWAEQEVAVDKSHPLKLRAMRVGSNRVSFRVVDPGKPFELQGEWDGQPPPPLADDMDISAWRSSAGQPFRQLREARQFQRKPQP